MDASAHSELKPATVVVTDFCRSPDLQPDAETAKRAQTPRRLIFRVSYGGSADPATAPWTAVCPDVAGFVAEGNRLGQAEIGSTILEQLAEFRDPQP